MKEGTPQVFDVLIITPTGTFFHGELRQYKRDWEVKLFMKDGVDVKKGEFIPIVDVFVAQYPKESGE